MNMNKFICANIRISIYHKDWGETAVNSWLKCFLKGHFVREADGSGINSRYVFSTNFVYESILKLCVIFLQKLFQSAFNPLAQSICTHYSRLSGRPDIFSLHPAFCTPYFREPKRPMFSKQE